MVGRRRNLLASTAMLAVLGFGGSAWAQTKTFDIPAEDAVKAIPELARQAGIQIVAPADQLKGVHTPAVSGTMDVHAALGQLLAGTGIEIASDDGQTVILRVHSKNAEAATNEGAASIETVIVTGSHIAGDATSPHIAIDRKEIVNSGYSNTAELTRSLPQNFGGGIQPTTLGTRGQSTNNISSASTMNLRGLGPESTLTLIDGHRMASDGFVGGVIDISAIPLAAIDRIEIVTDGASAIYGSDAVAGVANFVLRKDFDGLQTSVQIGTPTQQGGGSQITASQLAGINWDSGGALLNYEYSRQNILIGKDRAFASATAQPFTLVPEADRSSFFGAAHQDIAPGLTLFAEGLYTFRTSNDIETIPGYFSYYNKYRSEIYAFNFGADWQINDNWHTNVTGTIAHDHVNTQAFMNIGGPQVSNTNFDNGTYAVEALVNGSLDLLPTGDIPIAIGAGYRSENYEDKTSSPLGGFDRDVYYAFAEARIPLVTESEDRTGLQKLELSVAGRYERYSDFGDATNPKLGLLYVPVHGVSLRSTWGTSFRVPGLDLLDGQRQLVVYPGYFFPGLPAGAQVFLTGGSNRDLKPEKSETWTVGTDINPDVLPDLKLGVTLFGIGYRDRIIQPVANITAAFSDPIYAPFVQLSPSPAQQAAMIAGAEYYRDFTGPPPNGPYDPARVYGVIFDQYQNVSSQNASGVDLTANYHIPVDIGGVDVFGNGSWIRLAQHVTAVSRTQVLSGTIFHPAVFKARAGATWAEAEWSVTGILNYVSPETDPSTGVNVHVPSWTTADVQLSYSTADWDGWFKGLRVGLSVHNVFDTDPPHIGPAGFQASYYSAGYDSTNTSPYGRFVSLAITKDW